MMLPLEPKELLQMHEQRIQEALRWQSGIEEERLRPIATAALRAIANWLRATSHTTEFAVSRRRSTRVSR